MLVFVFCSKSNHFRGGGNISNEILNLKASASVLGCSGRLDRHNAKKMLTGASVRPQSVDPLQRSTILFSDRNSNGGFAVQTGYVEITHRTALVSHLNPTGLQRLT